MKAAGIIVLAVIPLLFACLPKKPEIILPEAPAEPLVKALEARRASFSGLRAVASVEAIRSGRRRAYDTVGIVIDGERRLRLEAFSPLGQSLVVLAWNGKDLLLRLEDGRIVRPGTEGLEKILGVALDAGELCALLSANLPQATYSEAKAYREPNGGSLLDLREGDGLLRRIWLGPPDAGSGDVRIETMELRRAGKILYQARYEEMEHISGYLVPKTVRIENPDKNSSLAVEFHDTDVNVPLGDELFTLPGGGAQPHE